MRLIYKIAIALLLLITTDAAFAQTNLPPAKPTTEDIFKNYKPVPFLHRIIPMEMGCHVEASPGVLTKTKCLSAEEIAKYPPPAPCTGADGEADCGIQSVVTPVQKAFGIQSIPMTEAYLGVTLQEYSKSVDTVYGKGAYSLQLNSNWFQSSPDTTGWVQFAYQNFLTSARFCVWNVHWPTNSNDTVYTPVCAGIKSIPLAAKVQFTVGGFVCAGSCTYFRPGGTAGPAVLWGWIHWQTLKADGSVCNSCDSGTVWATAPDSEGLAGNWTQISGSILGTSGSGINFSGHAIVRNVLAATACSIPLSDSWTCNTPQLNGQYADTAGWVTAEGNNLTYAPNPNWVIPQLPQSLLNCADGFCSLLDYEIYPK